MKTRDVAPFGIIILMIVGLLLPLRASLREMSDVVALVSDLHLEWARLAFSIPPDDVRGVDEFVEALNDPRLSRMAQFSGSLSNALDRLEEEVKLLRYTVNNGDERNINEYIRRGDTLFKVIRQEAKAFEGKGDAASRSLIWFALFFMVGFAGLWFVQTIQVRKLKERDHTNEMLSALRRRVQTHERRRLARELHDGVSQELAIARMIIDKMEHNESVRILRTAIASASEEIRLLYRAMDPRFTNNTEFSSIIRELVASVEHRSGQRINLQIGQFPRVSWSPETQLHIFRIAQESIHNVIRHAGARWVAVSLMFNDDGYLVLRVEDDGTGIEGTGEGFGKQSIRERAQLLGGTVAWSTREPMGTVVEAIIPVG